MAPQNRPVTPAEPGRASRRVSLDLSPHEYDAVLFDLDGVLTSTAEIHASAWKRMFDDYLQQRAEARGDEFAPFEITTDYKLYVDGRPRYEGVQTFLESRGIKLPRGTSASPAGEESVCGLGNTKDQMVQRAIDAGKVRSFPGSIEFAREVRRRGIKTAVVTSSRNCDAVLKAAGIDDLFEVRVDGRTIEDEGLRGKPAPDSFLMAAERLGVRPSRAVVVEDAIAGVQSGRAGGFGLVIGIDRHGEGDALRANGADVVVGDLSELLPALSK
jgi:beta-phosphoglucomutase family hydrolase